MDRPWHAEQQVDLELARALIEGQFPALAGATIEPYGEGWDNVAYLVGGEIVFRFPRRPIAVPLIETEVRVLSALAARLPLPVPRPTWVGAPALDYPWPFAGYRRLAGQTACRAGLTRAARARAAAPLAAFLRALHDIGPGEAAALGAGGDTLARTDVFRRVPETHDRLARVRALGALDPAARWAEAIIDEALAGATAAFDGTALVHGDLYARHLLVDEGGAPCGVIDWGDVHLGNPGLDLSLAYAFLPPEGRARFFEVYGAIPPALARLARFRALFSLAAIIVYGDDVGDEALVREGRAGLAWLATAAGEAAGAAPARS
jgi:aminoglycoside phosphotransferase (APT) family kinase protein